MQRDRVVCSECKRSYKNVQNLERHKCPKARGELPVASTSHSSSTEIVPAESGTTRTFNNNYVINLTLPPGYRGQEFNIDAVMDTILGTPSMIEASKKEGFPYEAIWNALDIALNQVAAKAYSQVA